ncbi:uncharacterized protein K441DRAFT_701733 [Cenococcum geophilum 1.58]|uniref:Uncharacterized protein n=1 Tax=Cenococcum geophilum 1.58 TaxID=794803 RepID=A0ACC8EKK6_9PEZI|nr:hypothetical protein K441DRAFT_701733 [Cenococcum geophilum 1.58]
MPEYWGGVSGSIRCSAANTLRLFNHHKRIRESHTMSTIASYIDDGCHLLDRIPSNREQRRRDRASNLHQDALLRAHTSHQVQFNPTVKTSKWVPATNLNDTESGLGSAIDDGLGPPPPPPHIPPYTATDKPPVRASTSVAHKMEWDIASDSLSYIDDGLGFQTSQTALPRAPQANVEDSELPKKAPGPPHRQSAVPAVNVVVPKPNTSLQRVARARNSSKDYSSDVAKVTMEDIRSTIENMKAITSNIVPPRATKRHPIPISAPPKLPIFVIRNKADTRTVVVDGAEEPIQFHSRQGSLERTKAMPQVVELPVYPVFVNKVHYTPKARPLMAISKPKNPEVHQGELKVIEPDPDPDPEPSQVPVPKEGQKQQKKKGQVGMKKESQPDQGKKNKKEGKHDPKSPSTLIEPKSENDIGAWDEGIGIDNLVTSPPGGSPRLSNPGIFMSGGLGFLSPPTSVKSEKPAKKNDSEKKRDNQKKKGKKVGGSKEEKDNTQTKGDDEGEDKKGDDGGMDKKGNDIEIEAANHNAGEWGPQTAKAFNVWSGAEQQGQELGLGIQEGVSMPYGYPPFPRQQQEYMLPGFPGYPPQGFQYPLSGPVFPSGMQFLTDTNLQSAQDSPNYKPPAVESVPLTPTRTNARVALPRTPGGRMANGYDDREGYCNQVWGGIPVRVAEWRL